MGGKGKKRREVERISEREKRGREKEGKRK